MCINIKNGTSDITGIADEEGNLLCSYIYDGYGKCEIIEYDDSSIGHINPFRYRGYYYDEESGFYYLNARYYNPEVGRFITADEIEYFGADGNLLSYNLFAYCGNNPINRTDEGGNLSVKNWIKIGIGTVALAGAIALMVATGGGAAAVAVGVAKIVGSIALSTATSAGLGYLINGK